MGWLKDLGVMVGAVDPAPIASVARSGPVSPQAMTVSSLHDLALHDGALADFLRGGTTSASGALVNSRTVLRNATVYRSVTLISNAMGMLPLGVIDRKVSGSSGSQAADHQLNDVLRYRPNGWQTPFVFKRLMQHRALLKGNAYARRVGLRGRTTDFIPLDPDKVEVKQRDDLSVYYRYNRPKGGGIDIEAADMLHVMGPSEDGLRGIALVDVAADVLGLSLAAQQAAARVYRNGVMAGGMLSTPNKLSEEAIAHLKDAMTQYQGVENSGKWIVGEEGLEAKPFASTLRDAQNVEQQRHQIEEVGRIFGVPRPFLMVDDTSWGSGIEQLAIYFVQYGLAPWFVCWEQAIERICLSEAERRMLQVKFNERALLRGSMKDQAEFFARALGAPGAKGWMTQDEVRNKSDLPEFGGPASTLAPAAPAQGSMAA